jgi:cobaltochelatase CobS
MQSREELEKIVADTTLSQAVRDQATRLLTNEFAGDEVAQKMIQLAKLLTPSGGGSGGNVDKSEVEDIVRDVIKSDKIDFDDLDSNLKSRISALPQQVQITITQKNVSKVISSQVNEGYVTPLVQKILSDVEARNNVYLYGGAGTGKTFSAEVVASALKWELIEVNCNQFTSPLELIGGQTIDGYQEGKVIRAWANLKEDGTEMGPNTGCVLLLDELPKIDPNTAGILNSALAKIADYKDGQPSKITNGRGQRFVRKNIFVMATGNTLLNSDSVDYEANFKQDLSLQDRFVGSTYEVFINLQFEFYNILQQKWAFIFIYMNKLRKAIDDNKLQSKAFVSIRIMKSIQRTYNVYRTVVDNPGMTFSNLSGEEATSYTPSQDSEGNLFALTILEPGKVKTLEDGVNEFLNLFTEEQREKLKVDTDFDGFLRIVEGKNRISNLDDLNTQDELDEVNKIIALNQR